ncbi:MAG TPA: hypothetical protein VM553_15480 [Dongiaceae bacterium]|nr:hypothetical protein [Dongiaceae bacterium]
MIISLIDRFQSLLALLRQSPQARVFVAALMSAGTWFAWAFWANRHDLHHAWISGLSQGGVSFITTSVGSSLLEFFYRRIGATLAGRILSVALVSGFSLAFMVTVHTLAHTPNLLITILPVFAVVLLYCSSYVIGLQKIKNQYENNEVEVVSP